MFLAHELAHQWFGDAVTPADWADLWLNESFASYAQWLWLDHIGLVPLETLAQRTLTLRQDFVESTAEPTVENLFGFERYDGGAVVPHALRQEIGDESFFTLLQRWVAENDGTSKRTADFTALAAEVAGRDHGVLRNVAVRRGRARRISRITPRRRGGTPSGAESAELGRRGEETAGMARRRRRSLPRGSTRDLVGRRSRDAVDDRLGAVVMRTRRGCYHRRRHGAG